MKEHSRVKLANEKEKYVRYGVHKGIDGIIVDPRKIDGRWLVSFDREGALSEIACIPVEEEDLQLMIE